MKPSGHIFYKDSYDSIYQVVWMTVGGVIDLTSTVGMPYVWGKIAAGYLKNGVLFKKGIVTVTRQVLRPTSDGYEIVAEGVSQYEDDIQLNFPCQIGPVDNFVYHLDRPIVDETEIVITDGPRWADPDVENDDDMIWGDIDSGGTPIVVSGTPLEFIDIWN